MIKRSMTFLNDGVKCGYVPSYKLICDDCGTVFYGRINEFYARVRAQQVGWYIEQWDKKVIAYCAKCKLKEGREPTWMRL